MTDTYEHGMGGLDRDEQGWDFCRCDCGWISPPCPDTETAVEFWATTPGLPPSARVVRAFGETSRVSLAEEYDPTPESGRRQQFQAELKRLADAEREEIISSSEILL